MRILMVASADEELNRILNEVGFNDRLISFWFIRNKQTFLEEYSRTGTYTSPTKESRNGKKRVKLNQAG